MPHIDMHTDLPWAPAPNELAVHLDSPIPHDHPVTSVVVLARDAAGRVLLTLVRSRGWDLPGGHVEAQEDPLSAATRELLEETGLVVTDPSALTLRGYWELHVTAPKPEGYPYPYPRSISLLYTLDLPATEPAVRPLPGTECSTADWFTPAEAQNLLSSKIWRRVLAELDRTTG